MKRSKSLELLDAEEIPVADLVQNLRELEFINRWLGGHALSLKAFQSCLKTLPDHSPIRVVELGSGGGDNLRLLAKWCRKQEIKATFTGIDLKSDCIGYAQEQSEAYPEISYIQSDYLLHKPEQVYDVAFSSLFCHHLNEEQIQSYLAWNVRFAKHFFINDLHRHVLAKWSIALLTSLFSKSYLVKHDAPLSVARAWSKAEWKQHFQAAGIQNYRINWVWSFRYQILGRGLSDV